MAEHADIAIIGGGPGGAATAIRAARAGARVILVEKGAHGRDKVCGDGLTPRAVAALDELGISLDGAHRTEGLRMIVGTTERELSWATVDRFPDYGAVWPRRRLDAALIDAAAEAGAEVRFETVGEPVLDDDGRAVGIRAGNDRIDADLVVAAAGAPGVVARLLGAERDPREPYGLAIRTYVESPRHDSRHIEACMTIQDDNGTWIPGYGWMFPCGDGTVNLGVGALSTMKGFSDLNLNRLVDQYREIVAQSWDIGPNLVKPRAWRLPMGVQRRHGPGWVAIGDAAGLVNPMNGEGIDYALESGMVAADQFLANPATAPERYDQIIGDRFDSFLQTGRRFAFLIGHPHVMRMGLRVAIGTDAAAKITLQVLGNLVDADTPGAAGRTLSISDRLLRWSDPILRRLKAA